MGLFLHTYARLTHIHTLNNSNLYVIIIFFYVCDISSFTVPGVQLLSTNVDCYQSINNINVTLGDTSGSKGGIQNLDLGLFNF